MLCIPRASRCEALTSALMIRIAENLPTPGCHSDHSLGIVCSGASEPLYSLPLLILLLEVAQSFPMLKLHRQRGVGCQTRSMAVRRVEGPQGGTAGTWLSPCPSQLCPKTVHLEQCYELPHAEL